MNKIMKISIVVVLVAAIGLLLVNNLVSNNLQKSNETNNKEQIKENNKVEETNKENKIEEKQETHSVDLKEEILNDYVKIVPSEHTILCSNCTKPNVVKRAVFSNLPEGTTVEFENKQKEFNSLDYFITNELYSEVYNNILSVYTKEIIEDMHYQYNNYSLNINLNNKRIITNEELLKIFNISSTTMYEKILNNIANTVKTDKLLLTTTGDIDADKISINNFRNNIKTYSSIIDNRYDAITLYIKDEKLTVVYNQDYILSLLGLGTHMNIGLIQEPQSIQLN